MTDAGTYREPVIPDGVTYRTFRVGCANLDAIALIARRAIDQGYVLALDIASDAAGHWSGQITVRKQ